MLVRDFEHNGNVYTFEPPVEVGEREVTSLAELSALAKLRPHLTATEQYTPRVEIVTQNYEAILDASTGNEAVALNSLLRFLHTVTVRPLDG
jgi:hypothetical protein